MCLNEDIGIIWIYFLYFLDSIAIGFSSYTLIVFALKIVSSTQEEI